MVTADALSPCPLSVSKKHLSRPKIRRRTRFPPTPQVLPGKIEFDYLPENCQGVLMQPVVGASAVVIVGTNRARAFTPKDIAWVKGVCDQAALFLQPVAM